MGPNNTCLGRQAGIRVNPFLAVAANTARLFGQYLSKNPIFKKYLKLKYQFQTNTKNSLSIIIQFMLIYSLYFKGIVVANDTFQGKSPGMNGLKQRKVWTIIIKPYLN